MAWPATRQPTDSLTGELVPQIWSAKVLDHTRRALIAEQVVSTEWGALMTMGDYIYIPVFTELSGATVDPSSDGVMTNLNTTVTTSNTSITIDVWWEVPVSLDDSVKRQTQVGNLLEKLASNAAYTWKKKLDGDTTALFSSLTSTWRGSDGQTFTDDLLIDIMEGLDEADIPAEDRNLVGDPSVLADMRKIDKFMTFDYTQNPLRIAGYRGMIDQYALPVFITNNLTAATTGNYCAVLNKEAIGLAVQSPMDVETWREPRRHADVINTSGFYGVDVIRSTFGAYFYSRKS